MKRAAVVGLGLAAFLAFMGADAFHDHDVLWTVYQDGSRHGWVVGPDDTGGEELACIKGGIGGGSETRLSWIGTPAPPWSR